jgi:hypothetical protein
MTATAAPFGFRSVTVRRFVTFATPAGAVLEFANGTTGVLAPGSDYRDYAQQAVGQSVDVTFDARGMVESWQVIG